MPDIAFTQFLRPNGRATPVIIDRPAEISTLADHIIKAGYRFECEHLTTGHTSLTIAGPDADGEDTDLDIAVVPNGPEVPTAIDSMIKRFAAKIGLGT